MKKAWKIGLGMLGVTSIATITVASVISCSNNNNNSSNKDQKEASSSLAYIPYSDLSKTVLINGKTGKASWTYDEALTYWTKVWNQETATEAGFQKVVGTALDSFSNVDVKIPMSKENGFTIIKVKNLKYNFLGNKKINLSFTYINSYSNGPSYEETFDINNATLIPNISNLNTLTPFINNSFGSFLIQTASLYKFYALINIQNIPEQYRHPQPSWKKISNNLYNEQFSIANYTNSTKDYQILKNAFISTYNKDLNFGIIDTNN